MRFDFHVHTELSPCSRLALGEILAHARQLGLDGVCLTDHDTMAASLAVREGIQDDGLCVIIGIEYASSDGDILLFGPVEHLQPGLGAATVMEAVTAVGGVAVAAHPYRAWRPAEPALLGHGALRLVEVENGRNRSEENVAARAFAARRGLVAVGGSDAHSLEELGRVVVSVDAVVRSRADFVAALRTERCYLETPDPRILPRTMPHCHIHAPCQRARP